MTKEALLLRHRAYWQEAERHLTILKSDFEALRDLFPLGGREVERLSLEKEGLYLLDQIAYRYLKLQDVLGRLLFYYMLGKGEAVEGMTMVDLVNLAHKKGFPINEDLWMELRFLRNSFTHEYPDSHDEMAVAINRLRELLPLIEASLEGLNL